MKGKIDKNGFLSIERAGKLLYQTCLHKDEYCGHHCPLFGEPKLVALNPLYKSDKKVETALVICHGKTLVFNEFTDERKEKS